MKFQRVCSISLPFPRIHTFHPACSFSLRRWSVGWQSIESTLVEPSKIQEEHVLFGIDPTNPWKWFLLQRRLKTKPAEFWLPGKDFPSNKMNSFAHSFLKPWRRSSFLARTNPECIFETVWKIKFECTQFLIWKRWFIRDIRVAKSISACNKIVTYLALIIRMMSNLPNLTSCITPVAGKKWALFFTPYHLCWLLHNWKFSWSTPFTWDIFQTWLVY